MIGRNPRSCPRHRSRAAEHKRLLESAPACPPAGCGQRRRQRRRARADHDDVGLAVPGSVLTHVDGVPHSACTKIHPTGGLPHSFCCAAALASPVEPISGLNLVWPMPSERIEEKWIAAFARVLELSQLKHGEPVALLSETQSRTINVQLAELAALRLGARAFHLVLPTPRQGAKVPVRSTGASDAVQR